MGASSDTARVGRFAADVPRPPRGVAGLAPDLLPLWRGLAWNEPLPPPPGIRVVVPRAPGASDPRRFFAWRRVSHIPHGRLSPFPLNEDGAQLHGGGGVPAASILPTVVITRGEPIRERVRQLGEQGYQTACACHPRGPREARAPLPSILREESDPRARLLQR